MVRAPCCEKTGLKKGPWTLEEDQILISYVQLHGHGNWRALPKQAGLLRCGKSCRLRWTNYLRPDIKRGNFSKEEEETIIELHEMLGNRWSAIAARLPGRTDNEIKNVWHTHLKKKLKNHQVTNSNVPKSDSNSSSESKSMDLSFPPNPGFQTLKYEPGSPQDSSSELSSVTDQTRLPNNTVSNDYDQVDKSESFPQIDESFWSEELSIENSSHMKSEFPGAIEELGFQFPFSPTKITTKEHANEPNFNIIDDGMDFWYNLLIRAGGLPDLPEF